MEHCASMPRHRCLGWNARYIDHRCVKGTRVIRWQAR
jgi:hypothetical protein